MIKDEKSQVEIRESWAGVLRLKEHDRFCPMIPGGGIIVASSLMPEGFWNLPFLLAYSVLDDVLTILHAQGFFECKSWMLGPKMEASKDSLPWKDYELVEAGKNARNELAHRAVILSKKDCFRYIDAIEVELTSWGII